MISISNHLIVQMFARHWCVKLSTKLRMKIKNCVKEDYLKIAMLMSRHIIVLHVATTTVERA